jgi:hypothetical protein
LKCKCPKWPRMSHLDICNTSYGRKKGWESNWQFDSRPLEVGNRPDSGACRWSATHPWKDLEESYNFGLDLILIWVGASNYERPKSRESKPRQFRDSTLGVPGKKKPFGCKCGGELQRTLYGGRWWLPPNPGRGESSESKVARDLSQHWKCAEWVLTNLLVRFGCRTE